MGQVCCKQCFSLFTEQNVEHSVRWASRLNDEEANHHGKTYSDPFGIV